MERKAPKVAYFFLLKTDNAQRFPRIILVFCNLAATPSVFSTHKSILVVASLFFIARLTFVEKLL